MLILNFSIKGVEFDHIITINNAKDTFPKGT